MKIKRFLMVLALVAFVGTFIPFHITRSQELDSDINPMTGLPVQVSTHISLEPLTSASAGGKVLWDLTHGVHMGQYDPAHRYSSLASVLNGLGYTITTTTNIGRVTLSNYDVLVVCLGSAWNSVYTSSEKSKIESFVQNGGGLFIMGNNTACPNRNINPISQAFGITCGVSNLSPTDLYFRSFAAHSIFTGVSEIYYRAGGELKATSPGKRVAWSGSKTTIAVAEKGSGRVVVTGDGQVCDNQYIGKADNQRFSENVFKWLSSGGASPTAGKFDFNDGTLQGWTLQGAYDETGGGPYRSNFTFSWIDHVDYPSTPYNAPWHDNKGSATMFTSGGHGVTQGSGNWWIMQFHSPNLSASSTWQNATGYTVEIADGMSIPPGTTLYTNLYVVVYDLDQAKDRYFYNGTAQPIKHYTEKGWNHFSYNWSGLPTNRIIKEIFVNIWGKKLDLIEGAVHLDEVTPIGGAAGPSWIKVTVPNGGEVWYVGTDYDIEWDTDQEVGTVKIELSTTGGSSWVTYRASTPNDGRHGFTPKDEHISDRCLFRVTSNENPSANDRSDNLFKIRAVTPNEPDISVSPTSWNYGTVAVGNSSSKTFTVFNKGNATLNVSSTLVTGTHASQFKIISGGGAFTVAPLGSHSLIVRFSPTSAGSKTAALRINSNDPDENPLLVDLNGTGIAAMVPDISVSPTSWNYGTVAVGNSSSKTFTVFNKGNATLNVSSTLVTGTHASQFKIISGGGAFTVAPLGSHSLIVRFSPTSAGSKTAALRISSNDPDENPYQVNLTGVGRVPSGPAWKVPITVKGDDHIFTLIFGGDPNASDGYDTDLDEAGAPPGMTYYAYFEISVLPNFLKTDIRRWASPYTNDIDWKLIIYKASGINSNLSWNPDGLPTQGHFALVGPGLNINMRNQSSAQVSGDATLIIQYRQATSVTYDFPRQGWYLISLPVIPSNNKLSVLFPNTNIAYGYNSSTGSYYAATTLEPRKGYWLLIMSAASVNVSGTPLTSYTEHYAAGWHLIGSVIGTTDFSDPKDNPNGSVIAAYGWDVNAGQYVPVYPPGEGKIKEKEGYWLAVIQDCDVTIGNGGLAKAKIATNSNMADFQEQFGSQPPIPPFVAEQNVAQLLPITEMTSCNYPNPFNPSTVIEYSLPKAGLTQIYIYNAIGQKIRTLLEEQQASGIYQVIWNGRNDNGELVTNGLYLYRIINSETVETRKMLMLK